MSASTEDDPFARIGDAIAGGGPNGVRPERDHGEAVLPVPDGAPVPMRRHSRLGAASRMWEYRDASNRLLFIVARFDRDGGKMVLPQTLRRLRGELRWAWKGPCDPRPLYGLPSLAERPSAPVLIVEGEKAADAAVTRLPDFVVVTWQGGSKATGKADWSPLAGREVTIWPDADEPGKKAADDLVPLLKANGVRRCGVVALPESLPEGWDLADDWTPGFGLSEADEAARSPRVQEVEVYWPKGFTADSTGVWWAPKDNGKGEEAAPLWLCGTLEVLASARDEDGGDWSIVVEFRDPDGRRKREIIGKGELAGDGVDVRRRLMSAGLPVSSNKAARERLQAGLSAVSSTERARLASSTGWRGPLYVLPHRTIGTATREPVIYRGRAGATHHGEAGSYSAWRGLAARASGNAFLLFALSCAFAAPLMRMLGGEGGGFHARGESSTGKTTLLRVAGSVWGGGGELGFAQSWRNTDNALEAVALAHNDGLLCLDELRQLDPSAAGAAAYALAAGVAKGRLRADAEMRARATWRVLILSAGEIGLGDAIRLARGKDKAYAGQELRLIDLDADMGAGLGAWQNLHGSTSPAAFSEVLKAETDAHYGHAGPLFLERLLSRRDELEVAARDIQVAFLDEVAETGDTGQARRGAQRFALAAVGGELAALLDVTPWKPGEASDAAALLFRRWARQFGRSIQREDQEAAERVRAFIERYEHSRFRWLREGLSQDEQLADELEEQRAAETGKFREGEARSLDAAGFKGNREGVGLLFHFNPIFWKSELFAGMDASKAARALKEAGVLISNSEKGTRYTNKVRVPGGSRNFYSVSHSLLLAEQDDGKS